MESVFKAVEVRGKHLNEQDKKYLFVLEYLGQKWATQARMAVLRNEVLSDLGPVFSDCEHVLSELEAGKMVASVDDHTFRTPLGTSITMHPYEISEQIEYYRNRPYKIDTNVPNRSVMVINPS